MTTTPAHTSVKLPEDLREKLREVGKRQHRSLSNTILVACEEWLALQREKEEAAA